MLEIEALPHAAELGIEIAADELQGDFLAGVAGGVVDFAEAAAADAALDHISGQRPGPASIQKRTTAPRFRLVAGRHGVIGCIVQSVLHGNSL